MPLLPIFQDKTKPSLGKVSVKDIKCTTYFVGQNNKITNNPIQKWAGNPKGHLTEDTLQMASGHMRECSTSSATGEWLIKTKATQHLLEWSTNALERRKLHGMCRLLVKSHSGTQSLTMLNIRFSSPGSVVLVIYPDEHTKTCAQMFTVALFVIVKRSMHCGALEQGSII